MIAKVINHGISENLLHDTMDVFREFFALPPEDKASFFSEDPNKLCRLITGTGNYDRENVHLWRDALRHACHPLDKFIPLWPQQLLKYREHVGKCSTQVRKVALNILELISEGLGIEYGHFSDELSQETGFKDREWIGVEPFPQGLVIISNGKLKCAEHRALTNPSNARTSAAFFVAPSQDCHIQPATALINASNPQVYKGFQLQRVPFQLPGEGGQHRSCT
ncbi:hypothetical protein ABKV19_025156 [Rosa sericea]